MMTITEKNGRLEVASPFHPALPSRARALGGRWDAGRRVWTYDVRDIERVTALYANIYGNPNEPTTSIEVALDEYGLTENPLYVAGRQVARRWARDEAVRLGEGVIVLAGGFSGSGGSRANPRLSPRDGTILLIRDVPQSAAREAAAGRGIRVVGATPSAPERSLA